MRELQAMGNKAYTRHLRVAGDVAPNSIQRNGTNAHFGCCQNKVRCRRLSDQGRVPLVRHASKTVTCKVLAMEPMNGIAPFMPLEL